MCNMEVVETDGNSEVGTAITRGLKKKHAIEVIEEELQPLEDCLTCQLCKETLKAPMILACGHNYCSGCIRRALSFKSSCPTCREDAVEGDMRRNLALGQIIDSLHNIKARMTARMGHPQGAKAVADALQLPAIRVSDGPGPKPISGKWNYSMMGDRELKKLCRECGLPDKGDKKTLGTLHKEFVLRFNAECDATNPKSEADIRHKVIRELTDESKRSEAAHAHSKTNIFSRAAAGGGKKESEGDQFGRMIAELKARKREEARLKKPAEEDSARGGGGGEEAGGRRGGGREGREGREGGGQTWRAEGMDRDPRPAKRHRAASDNARGPGPGDTGSSSDQTLRGLADTDMGRGGRQLPLVPKPWVAVWSEPAERPFYFNGETNIGTFHPPWDTDGSQTWRGEGASASQEEEGGGRRSGERGDGESAEGGYGLGSSGLIWHGGSTEGEGGGGWEGREGSPAAGREPHRGTGRAGQGGAGSESVMGAAHDGMREDEEETQAPEEETQKLERAWRPETPEREREEESQGCESVSPILLSDPRSMSGSSNPRSRSVFGNPRSLSVGGNAAGHGPTRGLHSPDEGGRAGWLDTSASEGGLGREGGGDGGGDQTPATQEVGAKRSRLGAGEAVPSSELQDWRRGSPRVEEAGGGADGGREDPGGTRREGGRQAAKDLHGQPRLEVAREERRALASLSPAAGGLGCASGSGSRTQGHGAGVAASPSPSRWGGGDTEIVLDSEEEEGSPGVICLGGESR